VELSVSSARLAGTWLNPQLLTLSELQGVGGVRGAVLFNSAPGRHVARPARRAPVDVREHHLSRARESSLLTTYWSESTLSS